jgi:aldehyde dehydrogenase (NAD+)/retinal dehydrogenase
MAQNALDPGTFEKLYLYGEYVKSSSTETLVLRNPKDNSIVTDKVPIASEEDVDIAVSYAEEALNGPWSTFSGLQRATCLHKLRELVELRLVDLLTLDCMTTGNPVSLIPTRERNYIRNGLLYLSE